jgi:hypothetical protein
MIDQGGLWAIATVVGPLLLLGALIYGVIVVSRKGPTSKQLSEDATRDLYKRGERQERREEVESPSIAPNERDTMRTPTDVKR